MKTPNLSESVTPLSALQAAKQLESGHSLYVVAERTRQSKYHHLIKAPDWLNAIALWVQSNGVAGMHPLHLCNRELSAILTSQFVTDGIRAIALQHPDTKMASGYEGMIYNQVGPRKLRDLKTAELPSISEVIGIYEKWIDSLEREPVAPGVASIAQHEPKPKNGKVTA